MKIEELVARIYKVFGKSKILEQSFFRFDRNDNGLYDIRFFSITEVSDVIVRGLSTNISFPVNEDNFFMATLDFATMASAVDGNMIDHVDMIETETRNGKKKYAGGIGTVGQGGRMEVFINLVNPFSAYVRKPVKIPDSEKHGTFEIDDAVMETWRKSMKIARGKIDRSTLTAENDVISYRLKTASGSSVRIMYPSVVEHDFEKEIEHTRFREVMDLMSKEKCVSSIHDKYLRVNVDLGDAGEYDMFHAYKNVSS